MKKLLFIRKSNPQVGGVEMQMLRIALWLRENNLINAALVTNDLSSPLTALFTDNNFEVYYCKLSGRFYVFTALSQLLSLIKKHNISFLQAHMFRESIVCRCVKIFRPDTINIFRIETYIDCSSISELKKTFYHKLALISRGFVDYYIANGNLISNELQKRSGVSKSDIHVVYNGVEQFGTPDKALIEKTKDDFLPVAMVANFIKGKGHELLFDVISILRQRNIKVKVVLFGDDMGDGNLQGKSYKQELKERAIKLDIEDHIEFFGFSKDLANDLRNFHVVILPSYSEGTPNTILEAMSAGKLVVTSDAGELAYIVEDKVSGFVHKIGDGKKLASILEEIFTLDSANFDLLRENGRKRWQTLFSLDGMMREMLKVYEKN